MSRSGDFRGDDDRHRQTDYFTPAHHIGKIDLPDLADKAIIKQYKPYSIGTQPHKITSVQFNSVGSEILISYSEDYVYLFSNRLFHVAPVFHDTAMMDSSALLSRSVYLSQLERYSPGHRRKSSFVKRKPLPIVIAHAQMCTNLVPCATPPTFVCMLHSIQYGCTRIFCTRCQVTSHGTIQSFS